MTMARRRVPSSGFRPTQESAPVGQYDWGLIALFLMLLCIGLLMVLSASGVVAERINGDKYFFFKRQLIYAVIGGPVERRTIFGVTFEQRYNDLAITEELLQNIVTEHKELSQQAKNDMLLAQIVLKYTQSNSVCYVKNGQTLGVGAGQQSRIHCTRLAGDKADIWWLRQHPKVLALPFLSDIRRPARDNAIDLYISQEHDDVLADGVWQTIFTEKPPVLTQEEKTAWIAQQSGVTVGSDAFFPFGDNVERAHKSGVKYIVQPGGSIRDDHVIATADKYGMVMAFTGVRLFHH